MSCRKSYSDFVGIAGEINHWEVYPLHVENWPIENVSECVQIVMAQRYMIVGAALLWTLCAGNNPRTDVYLV